LGKLFDSHPEVLYRHEPDIVYRPNYLPKSVRPQEEEEYIDAARIYLDRLAAASTLKTAGPLPVLAKCYRSLLGRAIRTGSILGVRGVEMVARGRGRISRIQIPDLISGYEPRIVIKSVSLLAYARLFAMTWPLCRTIIIIRHPCGQVASFLHGIELGKFVATPYSELAKSEEAERLGLKVEQFSHLSTPEQLAWQWAFFNQRTLQEVAGLSNIKVLLYDDLAGNPLNGARNLFEFAGLAWDAQVERFIGNSTRRHGSRYYGLKRNPLQAANRWRQALSVDDQQRIAAIASRTPIGRSFLAPISSEPAHVAPARPGKHPAATAETTPMLAR
jgi:hypothetical protein